jgi:hypothetical protein
MRGFLRSARKNADRDFQDVMKAPARPRSVLNVRNVSAKFRAMGPRLPLLALSVAALTSLAFAETVKDREGAVRKDRTAMEYDARWIYNDFKAGLARAKQTGKPLLVVLRCVPCLSCAGIDAQVLEEKELIPLLEQFVCVRVINANALDLSLLQFDYDLSFSTLIFNGDGTIYGRYGSWTHQHDPMNKTTAGFRSTLEGALAFHLVFPANNAGWLKDDVITELDGSSERITEGTAIGRLLRAHKPGDKVKAKVLHAGKSIELSLPIQ